jgi:hypothetical protein
MASMRGTSRVVAACAIWIAGACGTGDTRVDPGDLELRDLLGLAPEVAHRWDAEQRAAARRVLVAGLDGSGEHGHAELVAGRTVDERVRKTLEAIDVARFAAGDEPLGGVRVELGSTALTAITHKAPAAIAAATGATGGHAAELELAGEWGPLAGRGLDVLAALATDLGHDTGVVVVAPAPRMPAIAGYVPGAPARLVVNPVLVAALDPHVHELTALDPSVARESSPGDPTPPERAADPIASTGNPYSFYGSVAECAYAQRTRCETCLALGTCEAITATASGTEECQTFAADGGRGYFLICINLALAIRSVNDCAAREASSCPRDAESARALGLLEANAHFLEIAGCATGLDTCLAKIYGAPQSPFPGLDGGMPPPNPPRDIDINCGDSCSDSNANCQFAPTCDCSGPSCSNSLSCGGGCASSNSQSGCGGDCGSCDSGSSGGTSGGSCGGSSGSSGGDCGGGDCGGGSCGGGDCSGGDCGGGGCGGSSGGCGGSSGGCGGSSGGGCGGGSGSCNTQKRNPSAAFALAISLSWALLPVPIAALVRRRSRRRTRRNDESADASMHEEDAP